MNSRLRTLKQLVDEGMYTVDDRAVADAILARSRVRATVADVSFRATVAPSAPVRSFRRDPHARSFRLERKRA